MPTPRRLPPRVDGIQECPHNPGYSGRDHHQLSDHTLRMPNSRTQPRASLFDDEQVAPPPAEHRPSPPEHDGQASALARRDQAAERKRADDNNGHRLSTAYAEFAGEDVHSANAVGYLARWMVHAGLPYTQPKGNQPAWFKRSGKVYFALQPGYYQREYQKQDGRGRMQTHSEAVSYGYPFGSLPRLILAYMTTEVARTKSREIAMGSSLFGFMDLIGKRGRTGGERGTITAVKDMMQRLFTASMHIGTSPQEHGAWTTESFVIADKAAIYPWAAHDEHDREGWQTEIVITEKFYNAAVEGPVPVDMRILRELARSPMAMDIYSWLTYRFFNLGKDALLEWELLMQQFGTDTKDKYKFREMFERQLQSVVTVYPAARVETSHKGVLLKPSRTSVPRLAVAVPQNYNAATPGIGAGQARALSLAERLKVPRG